MVPSYLYLLTLVLLSRYTEHLIRMNFQYSPSTQSNAQYYLVFFSGISPVSPPQNNKACNIGQMVLQAQCLLRMSAGLSAPRRW